MKKANAVPQNKKTKTGYERYLNTFDIPEQYLKAMVEVYLTAAKSTAVG